MAVDEGVEVDQHPDRPRLDPGDPLATDQGGQRRRREVGLLTGGDVLRPRRHPGRDLRFQRRGDRFTANRIPLTGEMGHTGGVIDPGSRSRVPALLLQLTDPVVTHQPIDQVTAPLLERRHRQAFGNGSGDQLVGRGFERLLLRPRQPVGLPGQGVGMTHADGAVFEGAQGVGHLLHRVGPPGGLGRLPIPQPGPGRRLLRVTALALPLQRRGPGRHLGQHPRKPGLHPPDIGTHRLDRVGRHPRDLFLQEPDPSRHPHRIGVIDGDHITIHRQRHHAASTPGPPCQEPTRAETAPLPAQEGNVCSILPARPDPRNPETRRILKGGHPWREPITRDQGLWARTPFSDDTDRHGGCHEEPSHRRLAPRRP